MAPVILENEDHSRDAAFNKAMHKDSSGAKGGFTAMFKKDHAANQVASDEYFKHFDNKAAKDETEADRAVSQDLLFIQTFHRANGISTRHEQLNMQL